MEPQYIGLNPIEQRHQRLRTDDIESVGLNSILAHNLIMDIDGKKDNVNIVVKKHSDFIQPQNSDYTDCVGDITKCNAVQRIIHLLKHYEQSQTMLKSNDHHNIVLLYEYITSLSEYTMSTLMEDWYHSKTKHLKSEKDYKWFKSNKHINCYNSQFNRCIYIDRHRRPRGRDIYDINKAIDHKNAILREQIDSIHAFIFHAPSQMNHKVEDDDYNEAVIDMNGKQFSPETKTNENKEIIINQVDIVFEDVWSNKPESIIDCNVNQIIYIFNNGHVLDDLNVLVAHKDIITIYMKENELSGVKLSEMKSDSFINQLSDYLNNTKLRLQLGCLYKNIMNIDVQKLYPASDNNHITWCNKPASFRDCTLKQIIYILENGNIFNVSHVQKLNTHKSRIIKYFEQHELNGIKLSEIHRKQFMLLLSEHFGNKKLKLPLGALYSSIVKVNTKQFWYNPDMSDIKKQSQKKEKIVKSNKFMTSMLAHNETGKGSLYAFGEQYRYTNHFKQMEHPSFVEAKYNSLKEEICEYFKRENEIGDKRILLNSQLQIIESMPPSLHSILTKMISQTHINEKDLDTLWYEVKNDNLTKWGINKWIQSEKMNCQRLHYIINKLTVNVPLENDICINYDFIFVGLLEAFFKKVNTDIIGKVQNFLSVLRKKIKGEHKRLVPDVMLGKISNLRYMKLHLYDEKKDEETKDKDVKDFVKTFNSVFAAIQNEICVDHLTKYFIIPRFFDAIANNLELKLEARTYLINGYIKNIQHKYNYSTQFVKVIVDYYGNDELDELQLPVAKIFLNKLDDSMYNKSNSHLTSSASDVLSQIMRVNRTRFHRGYIAIQCRKYPSMLITAKGWAENNLIINQSEDNKNGKRTKQLMEIFKIDQEMFLNRFLYVGGNDIKAYYKQFAHRALQEAIISNQSSYIENQNNVRCQYYIEKAKVKYKMNSVKKMKAIWYHGMNQYHEIKPGKPLQQDHIIAMICYTDNSVLCTSFRETYRSKYEKETMIKQKARHSIFANMGRLLYEAFIFYASKESEIEILYHGMSIPLVFSTLYCCFDAPTSTTTASSVATEFGADTGIVIKFESSESSKYIRTLDMGLFSCFDRESEHLIFETRLHIKDIWIPTEGLWVGP
eukprot:540272_1